MVGTFGYMGPEQFQGRALPGSDVYGVGATVLSLLTGSEPEGLPHRGLAIDVRAALKGRASERLIRILEQMLEPDPDKRAQAIAPLLAQRDGPRLRAEPPRRDRRDREQGGAPREVWNPEAGRSPWDPSWQRDLRNEVRDQVRRARHEARDQARRARKEAYAQARAWRKQGRRDWRGPPWPLEVIFTLVFAVGLVAVTVVTQVALPLALRVLSVLFARRQLREAADAVQDAGGRAVRSIAQSRRWMRGEPPPPGVPATGESPRARVVPPEGPGIRVVAEPHPEERQGPYEGEDEEHYEDHPDPPAARRKG